MRNQPVFGTLLWLSIVFLLAVWLTTAVFLVMTTGPLTFGFYLWLAIVCAAEFVFFVWAANYAVGLRLGRRASGAVLVTIHMMIGAWLLLTILMALVWGAVAQGEYNSTLAVVYGVLTFLFFLAATMLYARDIAVQAEDRITQQQRVELQVRVADVDDLCQQLRTWAAAHIDQLVAADCLVKRLEGIRTNLNFAPPGKIGTLEEDDSRNVREFNTQIASALEEMKSRLAELRTRPQDTPDPLSGLDGVVDRLDSVLRRRQQFLLTGGSL